MAIITGELADFGYGNLRGLHPTLVFQPSGPALGQMTIHAPKAETIAPITPDGFFSVDLQPTDAVRPAITYKVLVQWGRGQRVDLPWKLRVPDKGGRLAELLAAPANPAATWVGEEPPPNPTPGTWWLKPSTGKLTEWRP